MDSRGTDKKDEQAAVETPEDVAVLYSWANLHGAKYRDFSASRREYRAQLRHRAAEQVRQQALIAQAEAETAAAEAETAARNAAEAARSSSTAQTDSGIQRSLREAEEAARTAAAERVEAARRAEAAAVAEAAARREEREIAEAHASAQRQAARYEESEIRRRSGVPAEPISSILPGRISDPYTFPEQHVVSSAPAETPAPAPVARQVELVASPLPAVSEPVAPLGADSLGTPMQNPPARRPRGYRPDDASGVRQIYRGPEVDTQATQYGAARPTRSTALEASPPEAPVTPASIPAGSIYSPRVAASIPEATFPQYGQRLTDSPVAPRAETAAPVIKEYFRPSVESTSAPVTAQPPVASSGSPLSQPRPLTPFSQSMATSEVVRGRRVHDDFDYQRSGAAPDATHSPIETPSRSGASDPAGPAWLYAPATSPQPPRQTPTPSPTSQSSVADTLQQSRERVAARWYALKGVFEPGQDQADPVPQRQKETRTPLLAVFSLAGGVGKTSLVATLGRSLSSMGEKVLLTDTTSHGLLPFYFGASELRQGTVRTFSPPSGSTDAPIYLVSYDVDQAASDDEAQEKFVEEVVNNSRGTHRVLLDLNVSTSWVIRRIARMSPTVLVPVAPDMNSVISLQGVEKFFNGVNDGDGRPLQPFYILNQFDTSLPLHLDIREVMRRQLGDRLLPLVIRRAPSVSEALAEGMTVVDYAPDAAVSSDYLNLATWLRTVAAPATAGFRNVRWSER